MLQGKWLLLVFVLMFSFAFVSAITESVELKDYIVDFDYEEEDVEEGETFRIEVTVTNEAGEDREDIEISLDLEDPFDNIGDDSKLIGSLGDGDSKSVSFRVEVDDSVEEDFYPIEFDIDDNEGNDNDEFDVEVRSNKADIVLGNIQSLPTVLSADAEDIKLTLTLENIGDKDADSVRAKLNLPQGFSPSGSFSNIANLGVITSGSNKEAVFFIDSEELLLSGNYEAVLSVDYENSGDSEKARLTFDLPVKGRPQFLVEDVKVEPSKLTPGSEGKLSITIRNIGEEEGKETSIRVFENSDQPFEFNEKTNFIGSIKKGQIGTGIITFSVDEGDVSSNYIVRMQTRTINQGNVLIEEHSFSVNVGERESGNNLVLILMIPPLILAILLFTVFRIGKKKSR